MADTPPPPEPPRRFVTGHTASGSSTIIYEGSGTQSGVEHGKARFFMLWQDVQPTDNPTPTEDNAALPIKLVRDDGSLCRLIHMQPHHSTPMHRTVSLDYGIVLGGEVELELENVDGGSNQFQQLKVGDVVVQRGTNHAWHNRGDTWVTMVFVMLAANKIELNGKIIEPGGLE
jgi:quercetin dioxygenase-like cupin family protein